MSNEINKENEYNNKMKEREIVGRGSKSQLRYSQEENVVLKAVEARARKECEHLRNEYEILSNLEHANIVKTWGYQRGVRMGSQVKDVLLLEYACEGNLLVFLRKRSLSISQKRSIFSALCQAILYLHSKAIAHRDIKLDNVLVHSTPKAPLQIKIADFGYASHTVQNGQTILFNDFKGTRRGYMAPEIQTSLQLKNMYNALAADCFALGVLFFALFLNKLPFQYAEPTNKLFQLLSSDKNTFWAFHQKAFLSFATSSQDPQSFKDLFQKIVCQNANQRLNIYQIVDHYWFKQTKQQLIQYQTQKDQ